MTLFILILGALIAYYLTYLFNLVAGNLYLSDYEEAKFITSLKERKKKVLTYLLKNPKQAAVTALLVETFALATSSVLLFTIALREGPGGVVNYLLGALVILVGWGIHVTIAEVLAPNVKQERALKHITSRCWSIRFIMAILSPLVISMIRRKDRLFDTEEYEDKKEEIVERAIESLAESAGIDEPLMEREEREMIENIFELGDTEVREVMVPRIEIIAIPVGTTFKEMQRIAAESGFSRFPLYEEDIDNIRGIIYLKDLFKEGPIPDAEFDLLKFAREPYFVPESKRLDTLLEDFRLQRSHIAIVVDEFGGTAGLVTLEDLLEMIVGDIQDEHDVEEAEIVKVDDNVFLVAANLSMDDLSEELKLNLEEKDFETVGGYIYDLVGSLPKVGQRISVDGITFVVEKIRGQRIEKVKIIITADDDIVSSD